MQTVSRTYKNAPVRSYQTTDSKTQQRHVRQVTCQYIDNKYSKCELRFAEQGFQYLPITCAFLQFVISVRTSEEPTVGFGSLFHATIHSIPGVFIPFGWLVLRSFSFLHR
jgi:hypothetical protein